MDFTYNSHPVASTDGTVGVGGIDASARASLEHLAASAGDGVGLGSRLAGSSRVGAAGTGLLIVLGVGLASSLGNSLGVLLVLVDSPVEDIIILETFTNEKVPEDLAEVAVVGLVIESEGSGVVQVNSELVGEATAEDLGRGGHLLLHDTVVLLLLGGSLQSLPGERTTAKVEHDVTEGFHVVTTRLLNTQMSVNRGVASSTSQVLVLSVGNVEVSLWVSVLLGKTEIDNVDLVASLADAHEEVVRLDISVDKRLCVNVLDSGDELVGEEKNSLQGELSVTEVEEIFQTGTKKVENHGIVIALGTEPADEGNSNTAGKRLVDTSLIFQLGVLGLDRLKLDGDLLTGDNVGAEVDITERT
ncbi:hypothetical protein HG530_002133 [Fusarium avenaceum]|nr:hypothetical protein HG530_002133 [Fusarium avenaceum]